MAYKKEIPKPTCSCGKRARYEVLNSYNAPIGYYCTGCANRKVRKLTKDDDSRS